MDNQAGYTILNLYTPLDVVQKELAKRDMPPPAPDRVQSSR